MWVGEKDARVACMLMMMLHVTLFMFCPALNKPPYEVRASGWVRCVVLCSSLSGMEEPC